VTSPNSLVDIARVFIQGLRAQARDVYPILKMNAIRFLHIPKAGAFSLRCQLPIPCTNSRTNIKCDSPKTDCYLSYFFSFDIFARKTASAILTRRSITFYLSSCKPLPPHFSCLILIVTAVLRFTRADIHDIPPTLLDTILTKTGEVGSPEIVAENAHLIKCTSYLLCKAHASYRYAQLTPIPNVRSSAWLAHGALSLKVLVIRSWINLP
jgi:hypothetical protein